MRIKLHVLVVLLGLAAIAPGFAGTTERVSVGPTSAAPAA